MARQLDGEAGPAGFREAVAAAWDVVQQLTEQRRRAVDACFDLLVDVEDELQHRLKAVARGHRRLMARNGHLPPHQLQLLLQHEMKVTWPHPRTTSASISLSQTASNRRHSTYPRSVRR